MVPASFALGTPVRSPAAMYIAMTTAAGPLIVIDVVTLPRSISPNRSSMSESVHTATPALPTSPTAHASSESRPIRVGRSNAVDRPVAPTPRSARNRSFVSAAVPNPANMRMVQSFERYMDAFTRAACVRELARALGILRPVDRINFGPRVRREIPLRHAVSLSRAPRTGFRGGSAEAEHGGDAVLVTGGVAAVDHERAAGDERCVIGGEEQRRPPRSPRARRTDRARARRRTTSGRLPCLPCRRRQPSSACR